MLAIEYYHKIKYLFRHDVSKSAFIYLYTNKGVVDSVMFRYRKRYRVNHVVDVPHDTLLLSRDAVLPDKVIVQIKLPSLICNLYEW